MARASKRSRDHQCRMIVARHRERRAALKATISNLPSRIDQSAFNWAFGLSRIGLRPMAHAGELAGVTKAGR